jgi:hypothetical protein
MPLVSSQINSFSGLKNIVDIHRRFAKVPALFMKNDNITTALNFVLAVLAILGVIFALQTIFRAREFRSLQLQAITANTAFLRMQSLVNDVAVYNQKNPNPELTRLLQADQPKPATR